jgi:hypothetical protein
MMKKRRFVEAENSSTHEEDDDDDDDDSDIEYKKDVQVGDDLSFKSNQWLDNERPRTWKNCKQLAAKESDMQLPANFPTCMNDHCY